MGVVPNKCDTNRLKSGLLVKVFEIFRKLKKNINLLVVRFICEYFGWEHASHKVITGSTPNQLLICWSFSTWGCAHYEPPTTLHLHNLRNAPHARVTIGHHTIRNWVAHVDIMPHTHTLDLAKMAIHELPGFNLTWVVVCTLSHQYWHQSHRRYVTIILNSEVISDVWKSGKEDNVQPNVGDMIMNRIFWLVNMSCIVEPNFMVCGCLFTSRIPYLIEVVSGSFPNPSWIIQLQVSIWWNHILAGSSHLESS